MNPLFGGHPPEPSAEHLGELRKFIRAGHARLGLATDGDADRFGVVDADGTWITPNQVLALTLYHLAKHRGWKGSVVRTVVTSHQVDAVAAQFGVRMHEVQVGFKYIGAIMEREPVIVGGEESGGLSVRGHVPEKDGILACLLMAELVAAAGQPLGAVLKEITKLAGPFFTERINIHIDPAKKDELLSRLSIGLEKIRFLSRREAYHDGRLQISFAGRGMGRLPRQRHRARLPLLHRGPLEEEPGTTAPSLPGAVELILHKGALRQAARMRNTARGMAE